MTTELTTVLQDAEASIKAELESKPEVIDKGDNLDVTNLPIEARKWHRVAEAFAVVVDLKSSTQLGVSKHAASTASIYEAATGNAVRILGEFGADYIAIQGDGAVALYWGDRCFERAITAGITVKTFSERLLVPSLEKKWPTSLPEIGTGFKVGIASSPLLVKRVGIPRSDYQEPIWAGKAVNYATKAAQQADRHQMIVTGGVWDRVENNDYLAVSCGCGNGPSDSIWKDAKLERLPEDDADSDGRLLTSMWCETHGTEFCAAVLEGKTKRDDAQAALAALRKSRRDDAFHTAMAAKREQRRNLRRGWGVA